MLNPAGYDNTDTAIDPGGLAGRLSISVTANFGGVVQGDRCTDPGGMSPCELIESRGIRFETVQAEFERRLKMVGLRDGVLDVVFPEGSFPPPRPFVVPTVESLAPT